MKINNRITISLASKNKHNCKLLQKWTLDYIEKIKTMLFIKNKMENGFINLMISLWDLKEKKRLNELIHCLKKNISNKYISKIYIFYQGDKTPFTKLLKNEKINVINIKEYPTYKLFIDYANENLKGEIIAIANSDIYFDDSLYLLKDYNFENKVLALTRHHKKPIIGFNGKIWERNYGSQDSWLFKSPIKSFESNIRLGYFYCDQIIAKNMQSAGINVLNPSADIKSYHIHNNREYVKNIMTHEKSYFKKTKNLFFINKSSYIPITPLKRWKIYTVYSESHRQLYENWFKRTMKDDFEIVSKEIKQSCKNAKYMANGWVDTVINKIPLIQKAIDEHFENGFFIFSDVDIQWFAPVKQKILEIVSKNPKVDIFFQRDSINLKTGVPYFCTGFFICKANERTRKFWNEVKKTMQENQWGDQRSSNHVIEKKMINGLIVSYLPFQFWGAGSNSFEKKIWVEGMPLYPPKNILVHHANWTEGVKNKIKQLKYIKHIVKNKETTPLLLNKTLLKYTAHSVIKKYKCKSIIHTIIQKKYHGLAGLIGRNLKITAPSIYKILKPYFPNK